MKFLKANGLERKRKMEKQKMITKERCGREVKERGDGAVMWEKRKRRRRAVLSNAGKTTLI